MITAKWVDGNILTAGSLNQNFVDTQVYVHTFSVYNTKLLTTQNTWFTVGSGYFTPYQANHHILTICGSADLYASTSYETQIKMTIAGSPLSSFSQIIAGDTTVGNNSRGWAKILQTPVSDIEFAQPKYLLTIQALTTANNAGSFYAFVGNIVCSPTTVGSTFTLSAV